MKVTPRKCKHCGNVFTPTYSTTQPVCSPICAIGYSNTLKKNKADKEWQKEKNERKEALMSYSDWLNLLQKTFNTYIKLRDGKHCISCGTTKETTQYAAGHFWSVGGFPNVRFDEDNVHSQCNKYCNMHLSANIHEYRPRLIEKIGIERFEALERRARSKSLKLSIPEIQEKIKEYKLKIKELKS